MKMGVLFVREKSTFWMTESEEISSALSKLLEISSGVVERVTGVAIGSVVVTVWSTT